MTYVEQVESADAVDADASSGGAPPRPSRRPRVFALSFSGTGLAVAAMFFAFSLSPSLLPRAAYVQGLVSGVTLAVGYGIGAAGQWVWDYLQIPKPHGRARLITMGVLLALIGLAVVSAVWQHIGWQNEVRAIFHMGPTSPSAWPVTLLVTVVVAALILVLSRSLRLLFGVAFRALARHLPHRLAAVLSGAALVLLIWLLVTGVLVNGFFAVANAIFSPRDTATSAGVTQPQSFHRSGSPQSFSRWDTLGRQGRSFVGTGPSVEQLNAFSGGGALEPIRVYAGLRSASTVQARADLVLRELQRTGAFQRRILVVATTTGTGYLDPAGVDPLEYLFNGDTAVAGVQYSYLPSWISLLADQRAVKETSRVVFDTIHDYWGTLPANARPLLYLYGLSLGSFGVESILSSINVINEPVDGAFMSGPPFVNPMHADIQANRQPETAPWQPIYENGRTVRFTAEQNGLDRPTAQWGPTRLVYLQHASDPVVFFSLDLAFSEPDWLLDGQRGPDVPEKMVYVPLVTMWQVALDLPAAGSVPDGYGHLYSRRANLDSWVALTQPPGWSQAKTDELAHVLTTTEYPGE